MAADISECLKQVKKSGSNENRAALRTFKRECPLRPIGTWHMMKNQMVSLWYGKKRGLIFSFKY